MDKVDMRYSVFVCYAERYKYAADEIVQKLKTNYKIKCITRSKKFPGMYLYDDKYLVEEYKAISKSAVFVTLYNFDSSADIDQTCNQESFAQKCGKPIIYACDPEHAGILDIVCMYRRGLFGYGLPHGIRGLAEVKKIADCYYEAIKKFGKRKMK